MAWRTAEQVVVYRREDCNLAEVYRDVVAEFKRLGAGNVRNVRVVRVHPGVLDGVRVWRRVYRAEVEAVD